jgi:hypothetical protein
LPTALRGATLPEVRDSFLTLTVWPPAFLPANPNRQRADSACSNAVPSFPV